MYIGAHISIAGGHANALNKIIDIGGNALQIFSISPRGWDLASVPEDITSEFKNQKEKQAIQYVYFHASYLVNFADGSRIGHMSKRSLIHELTLASAMGVKGSIIHLGSFKEQKDATKYNTLIANIQKVLAETPADTLFIMENAGNRKIGNTMEEVFQIIKDVGSPRIKVCLDTCHLHAAGYSLATPDELEKFLESFDKEITLDKLELWHINDSRDPFGSFRDRHENIGQGMIGIEAFRNIVNHPSMKSVPMIIETPGFDGLGPDKENIDILKGLIL